MKILPLYCFLYLLISCGSDDAIPVNTNPTVVNQPTFTNNPDSIVGKNLVFREEFNYSGEPDPKVWTFENGFVRNEELQWYQKENALVLNGSLLIEAKKVDLPNPNYVAGSTDWKKSRKNISWTSSSIVSRGKAEYKYGTFVVRAKIDTVLGSWPAIWTLGVEKQWPSCGEIDIMEFYRVGGTPNLLANFAWGTSTQWVAKWDGSKVPLSTFVSKNAAWPSQFHTWRMDWTPASIKIFLDNTLINDIDMSTPINPDGFNPFNQLHYFLLNLAVGANGGTPRSNLSSIKYEVDYFRVYQ
jgi:beta-glucanase (GH16 family)